ncbi:MAG: hypothetical protein RLZZ15_1748 [Verrucomicrobiota bacterium]|jgi:sirohydrochlorin ferrochelatase
MTVALIDNGSLEPAAHAQLRVLAAELSVRVGLAVEPVSWKHSDRIAGLGAHTLAPWLREKFAAGEREFLLVPFFISAQGAIGSALRADLESLRRELGEFHFAFTAGLAAHGALPVILADNVRATVAENNLLAPAVIVVDHGGPSVVSAALRDRLTTELRPVLGAEITSLRAASMEGAHGPLLADVLRDWSFSSGDVVIAPLFLAPGRHAGPAGDLAQIARAAEAAAPALRCHFTALVGGHPRVVAELALALRAALAEFFVPSHA